MIFWILINGYTREHDKEEEDDGGGEGIAVNFGVSKTVQRESYTYLTLVCCFVDQ
jgi:hypothetical protein